MVSSRRRVLKGIGAATATVVGVTGTASAQGDEAKLRVAHAAPDAPAVDVVLDGPVSTSVTVSFGDVTGYLEVPTGTYDVSIPAAEFSATVDLAGEDYTAAAIGNLSPEGDEPGFTVDVFEDKLGVLDDGTGRVRVYHASPDAPAVDVTAGGLALSDGLTFGNAGPNAEVPEGTYEVVVETADGSTEVFRGDVPVEAGAVLTVFAMGEVVPEDDEPGFQPVLASEEAAPFGRGQAGGNGRGRRP